MTNAKGDQGFHDDTKVEEHWSKVFTHCNCCWWLRKQSSLLIHYSCCLGLFENVGLTHYSCYCGPFESTVGRPCKVEYLLIHYTAQFLLG